MGGEEVVEGTEIGMEQFVEVLFEKGALSFGEWREFFGDTFGHGYSVLVEFHNHDLWKQSN